MHSEEGWTGCHYLFTTIVLSYTHTQEFWGFHMEHGEKERKQLEWEFCDVLLGTGSFPGTLEHGSVAESPEKLSFNSWFNAHLVFPI